MTEALRPGEVVVDGVSEQFRIYHKRPGGLKDRLFRFERAVYEDFLALEDISFSLDPGDSLAVVGSNGSGKSTLLKCLAGILSPDSGRVEIGGRVASLLELGAGFHGDLSGRENIFLNGSILGMSRRELNRIFDEIVDLAGVEAFIDTPVRNYSSGMYVRLGFAIAINVNPDVLLIDEVLAVGDESFQGKCFERLHEFKRQGKTIVLVTHDLDGAVRICDRGLLLDGGKRVFLGKSREAVDTYRQRNAAIDDSTKQIETPQARWGTGGAAITDVALLDSARIAIEAVGPGQEFTFSVSVRFDEEVEEPVFGMAIRAENGTDVYATNTLWRNTPTGVYRPGEMVDAEFTQPAHLLPGRYTITTAVAYRDGLKWYDWWDECLHFQVRGVSHDHGIVNLNSQLEIRPKLSEQRMARNG